jgi:hypothetical protein
MVLDIDGVSPAPGSGLNNAGLLIGTYFDANSAYHAFVRATDGSLTFFDASGGGTGQYQGTYRRALIPVDTLSVLILIREMRSTALRANQMEALRRSTWQEEEQGPSKGRHLSKTMTQG